MSEVKKILLLQEIDCRIREIDRELQDIPARKKLEQTRLEEHERQVAEGEKLWKAKQAELKERELEIDALRGKIAKLRQQQMELKTNKEFKAMESEIEAVQAEIRRQEDKELLIMEAAEDLQSDLKQKRLAVTEEEAAVRQDVEAWDGKATALAEELHREKTRRAEAVVGVDATWLSHYERIFSRRDRALVPLTDGVCGGCHMQQPPYVLHNTRKVNAMVICEMCGRMLYVDAPHSECRPGTYEGAAEDH